MQQEIKRISYSELKNWKECPYRHKLIYLDKIPYFEGNEFTAFGTAIHKVCEEIVPDPDKDAIAIFNQSFDEEISRLTEENISLDASLLHEMREQSKLICESIIPTIQLYFGKFKVISVEEELLEPITEFNSYDKSFKGFIDMVIKTEDQKYHIIDWKTCSWGWSSQKKSDSLTNYQLTYYKNYFSKKYNVKPSDIETYFVLLKRTAKRDNTEVVRVTSGSKKIQNSLKLLENAVINIEKKNFIKNRLNCKYCKFKNTENCT